MAQKRRQLETVAGYVNTDGSIIRGSGFTVAKGTAGLFTITLEAGMRLIAATASPDGSANITATVFSSSERAFSVTTLSAGTVSDQRFHFIAAGVQQ